jgi:MFS family permease
MRPAWQVVSALGIFEILAWGSTYYLPAVLALPIATDTGWPLSWVISGLSLGLLVSAAVSPRIGAVIGQRGGRPVMALGAAVLVPGLTILGAAPNLAVFLSGWVVIGLGMGMTLYDPAFATLGRIYGAHARSAITRLTLWGGFASTICWPLSALLVQHVGWRGACFAYALLHLTISLPLALRFLPRALRDSGGEHRDSPGLIAAPTAQRTFVLLAILLTLMGTIFGMVSVHLLTLLQSRGETLAGAVAIGALVGPSQVGARLVEMAGRGKHHPLWTLRAAVILITVGLCLLALDTQAVLIAVMLYAAGNGLSSIARGTVPLALFGPIAYGGLVGRLARPALAAQAVAPTLGAALITYGGPSTMLICLVGLSLTALLLLALLKAPPPF